MSIGPLFRERVRVCANLLPLLGVNPAKSVAHFCTAESKLLADHCEHWLSAQLREDHAKGMPPSDLFRDVVYGWRVLTYPALVP
jgi:hypothetical protein